MLWYCKGWGMSWVGGVDVDIDVDVLRREDGKDGRYGTVGEGKEVGWMKGMELDGCLPGEARF